MSSDPRDPTDLGTSLRRALSERVSTVHAEPDFGDLKRRIDRAAYGSQRRGRLSLAAAALVVAAVVGGSLGAFLAPIRAQHGILSSSAKNQGGSLPTGPGRSAPSKHGLRASGPTNPGTKGQESPLDIKRATAAGTQLTTDGTWLSPVGVASGTSLNDCFAAELLTTTAAKGKSWTPERCLCRTPSTFGGRRLPWARMSPAWPPRSQTEPPTRCGPWPMSRCSVVRRRRR